jgi:hypothetical protein
MKPTVSTRSISRPGPSRTFLTRGSRVMKSWSDTTALPWVSALKSVDFPALV